MLGLTNRDQVSVDEFYPVCSIQIGTVDSILIHRAPEHIVSPEENES